MIKDFLIPVIFAGLATLGFSLVFNIRGKNLIVATLCGVFSWSMYLIYHLNSDSAIMPYFICGLSIALYSEIAASIFRSPATVFLIPGFIPAVPGGDVYRAMEACLSGDITGFAEGLVNTLKIGGAIALGVILMSSFFRLFRSSLAKLKTKKRSQV
jgi:uncharacterized membrane protein YjjB (DUF3815 family)